MGPSGGAAECQGQEEVPADGCRLNIPSLSNMPSGPFWERTHCNFSLAGLSAWPAADMRKEKACVLSLGCLRRAEGNSTRNSMRNRHSHTVTDVFLVLLLPRPTAPSGNWHYLLKEIPPLRGDNLLQAISTNYGRNVLIYKGKHSCLESN